MEHVRGTTDSPAEGILNTPKVILSCRKAHLVRKRLHLSGRQMQSFTCGELYYQGEALYIIKMKFCISSTRSVIYHQAAGRYTLTRDEIQWRLAAIDDMHRTSCGDDMPNLRLG